MELMRGNLEGMIQQKALRPDTARSVLTQLLSALEFLHGQGKLHGAIRPSNVLIDDHGTVKLSDFEETDAQGELRAPRPGKKYLAPEFIRSEFGEVGFQADLYCLAKLQKPIASVISQSPSSCITESGSAATRGRWPAIRC